VGVVVDRVFSGSAAGAALAMVPIIAREGVEGVRGERACTDGCESR
jgi:hypothetical protein